MKKSIVVVVFLFIVAVSGAFAQTTADEWFKKGKEYLDKDDYTNAITAFSEAIKRGSTNLDAYWFRGLSYHDIENYNAAISDYSEVIKNSPYFFSAYINRSICYNKIKKFDSAINDCDKVIKDGTSKYLSTAYIVRGYAYGTKGIYHKAVADYKTALEKGFDPTSGFTVDKSDKADMWFCGTLYMEIIVNRFLGKTDIVTKYENWLKTVCDKNKVTRAEIEAFYRDNIRGLIAAVVDEEFNRSYKVYDTEYKISAHQNTVDYIKQSLVNFFITPNKTNFDLLTRIFISLKVLTESYGNYKRAMSLFNIAKQYGLDTTQSLSGVRKAEEFLDYALNVLQASGTKEFSWFRADDAYENVLIILLPTTLFQSIQAEERESRK